MWVPDHKRKWEIPDHKLTFSWNSPISHSWILIDPPQLTPTHFEISCWHVIWNLRQSCQYAVLLWIICLDGIGMGYLAYLLIPWCWRQQRRVSNYLLNARGPSWKKEMKYQKLLLDRFRMLGGIAEKRKWSTLATKTLCWEVECSKKTPRNKIGVYCSKRKTSIASTHK